MNTYLIYIACLIQVSSGSVGDLSPFYRDCVRSCTATRCAPDDTYVQKSRQRLANRFKLWNCGDDCKYDCMWEFLDAFSIEHKFVPQFYGKWPLVRMFEIQEPASMVFSILNFIAHFKQLRKFRKSVQSTTPMYWVWYTYSLMSLNAWVWSTIFHTRDVHFTEFMDYSGAFITVFSYLFCLGIRVLYDKHPFVSVTFSSVSLCCLGYHIAYLYGGSINYDYNMILNIIVGATSVLGWLTWCYLNYKTQPYVTKCAKFMIISGVVTLVLELADFPPILWFIDAHALWHLTTSFLPPLFYSFIIDDCNFLRKHQQLKEI